PSVRWAAWRQLAVAPSLRVRRRAKSAGLLRSLFGRGPCEALAVDRAVRATDIVVVRVFDVGEKLHPFVFRVLTARFYNGLDHFVGMVGDRLSDAGDDCLIDMVAGDQNVIGQF